MSGAAVLITGLRTAKPWERGAAERLYDGCIL